MNGGLIFLIVVVAMFGGIALAALAVFLYFFYKAVKRLTVVAEEVYRVIQPLAQGNEFTKLLQAFQATNKMGKEIVGGLANITATVAAFNRYFEGQQGAAQVPASEPARTAGAIDFNNADSFFVAPSEEDAVRREVAEELRKHGVETEESAWPGGEPPLSSQVGDSV